MGLRSSKASFVLTAAELYQRSKTGVHLPCRRRGQGLREGGQAGALQPPACFLPGVDLAAVKAVNETLARIGRILRNSQ